MSNHLGPIYTGSRIQPESDLSHIHWNPIGLKGHVICLTNQIESECGSDLIQAGFGCQCKWGQSHSLFQLHTDLDLSLLPNYDLSLHRTVVGAFQGLSCKEITQ